MNSRSQPCCGVARFLTILDGPWATLIIRELLNGPLRFTELRKQLEGVSAHTLTHRLKRFEENGIVSRTAYAETPPRVVYELTEKGMELREVLNAMRVWGDSLESAEPEKTVSNSIESCPFSQK